jgi:hypothetical protein
LWNSSGVNTSGSESRATTLTDASDGILLDEFPPGSTFD